MPEKIGFILTNENIDDSYLAELESYNQTYINAYQKLRTQKDIKMTINAKVESKIDNVKVVYNTEKAKFMEIKKLR